MNAVARRAAEPARRRAAVDRRSHERGAGSSPRFSVQQRAANGAVLAHDAGKLARSVVATPGRPLDARTRAFMEPRFGFDFSPVRVHADEAAARSAEAVGARAYTSGSHIVFGRGQFAPGAPSGRHMIAHELTHVIQQARGPVAGRPIGGGVVVSQPGDQFERAARAAADIAMSERSAARAGAAPLAALPAASGSEEPVALQRVDWGKVGGIAGIVGAVLGGLALIVAGLAWLWPRNPNATAQGISMQPNPFAFKAPDSPSIQTAEEQKAYQTGAEAAPRTDKVLELRTDDSNDATFNLQRNTDGTNIISASIVPGETKGYLGGYNSSIATLVLSAMQTNLPAGGGGAGAAAGPQQSPASAAPAPAGETQVASGAGAGGATAASAGGASPAGAATKQVAREVIHFSGTNGPSRDRLQTFSGELLVTGDGNVVCTRCDATNGIGYGAEQGTFGLVDYRSLTGSPQSNIGAPFSAPSAPFPPLPSPMKELPLPFNKPIAGGGT